MAAPADPVVADMLMGWEILAMDHQGGQGGGRLPRLRGNRPPLPHYLR